MLRTVYLHGSLGERFGTEYKLAVDTAGEVVRCFSVQMPGFMDALKEGSYELIRGTRDENGHWLELEDVNTFRLGAAEFHIVPATQGSKGGGIIKSVLGVALIGAAVFFSGGTLAAPLLGGAGLLSGMTYGSLAMVGVALTLMGVATLLAPKKKATNQQNSFTLNGPQNSYAQGNPVPLVYGRVITGSVLISAGMDIENIPVGYDPTQGNTYVGTFNNDTGQGVQYTRDPAVYTGTEVETTYDNGTITGGNH